MTDITYLPQAYRLGTSPWYRIEGHLGLFARWTCLYSDPDIVVALYAGQAVDFTVDKDTTQEVSKALGMHEATNATAYHIDCPKCRNQWHMPDSMKPYHGTTNEGFRTAICPRCMSKLLVRYFEGLSAV